MTLRRSQLICKQIFEEVTVPPTKPMPQKRGERAVRIADLPPLAKGCFPVSLPWFFR